MSYRVSYTPSPSVPPPWACCGSSYTIYTSHTGTNSVFSNFSIIISFIRTVVRTHNYIGSSSLILVGGMGNLVGGRQIFQTSMVSLFPATKYGHLICKHAGFGLIFCGCEGRRLFFCGCEGGGGASSHRGQTFSVSPPPFLLMAIPLMRTQMIKFILFQS